MNTIILIVTTLSLGLMAGLFYSWSISVTPGLAKVGDEYYLRAFQSMNLNKYGKCTIFIRNHLNSQ